MKKKETLYNYSPFGITEMLGEASDNPFKYTGREDDGTGLYYYRARYYSPHMGRFISEDPIRFVGGMNFYSYVGNNPVNWVDPLGLLNWGTAMGYAGSALGYVVDAIGMALDASGDGAYYGAAIGGAAGAVTGTLIYPGVGTAVGGLVGGIGGAYLGGLIFDKPCDGQLNCDEPDPSEFIMPRPSHPVQEDLCN